MPSTFFGLDISLSGIYASQMRLNTAAHNVANADTQGYSKQTVEVKAGEPISVGLNGGMWGTGVDMSRVYSERSAYYDDKYRSSVALQNEYEAKEYYLKSIENYFNEVDGEGTVEVFDELFETMNTLSTDASSLEKRTIMNQIARTFTEHIANNYTSLQKVQNDINDEIKSCIEKINIISQQIVTINREINTLESSGATVNDLRDRREILIDELSQYVDVQTQERTVNADKNGKGMKTYSVYINGDLLLDTYTRNVLECRERKELNNQNDAEGLYDVYWSNMDEKFNITQKGLNGRLNALYELRDGNNGENFQGSVVENTGQIEQVDPTDPDSTILVPDDRLKIVNTNINAISKMNMPQKGYITFDGEKYLYDGFEAIKNGDSYEYYFNLVNTDDKAKIEAKANTGLTNVRIGESVNFKGIVYYQERLNEFIRTFSAKFNEQHDKGQDLQGDDGLDYFTYKDKITGAEYELNESETDFKSNDPCYYNMTADKYVVSEILLKEPKKIAVARDIGRGVDENDNMLELLKLRNNTSLFKQGSGTQYLHSIIDEIAVDTASMEKLSENQINITGVIDSRRISIAGVDLDEESMDLLKFQQAYKMSAKVFSVMSEIYDTLIHM